MADETKGAEWTKLDELAAMFMQAMVAGKYSEGRDLTDAPGAYAAKAYTLAGAFLAVKARGGNA